MWTIAWLACVSESDVVGQAPVVPAPPGDVPATTPPDTTGPTEPTEPPEPVTAPTCVIDAPMDGLVSRPSLDLLGAVVDADTPPAGLTASWTSDRSGPLFTGPVALDGRVDLVGALSASGLHTLTLSASDDTGLTCSVSHLVEINAAPGAATVSITPTDPRTLDVLAWLLDAPAEDPEGDVLTYEVIWLIDGTEAGTADVLDPALTARGQEVVVGVTASDALGPGPTAWSEPVVIGNTPPTAPGVDIVPDEPNEGDALICAVTAPSLDVDGDLVTYTMAWTVDGAPFPPATTDVWPGDGVASGVTGAGEVWTCTATPSDGLDEGQAGTDTATIVQDLPESDCPDGNCALRFDGIDDWLEVPHDPNLNISGRPWTVEAWVWFDTLNNCQTFVRKGHASSPTYEYWLHKNLAPNDSAHWLSWTGWNVIGWSAFDALRWHHFAGTWDPAAGVAEGFIDGASYGTTISWGVPTANTDALRIGIDWDFGCEMNGVIDEVRISDTLRYAGPFVPDVVHALDANTVALWHFDEFVGPTAHDASVGGHHAAIMGATWTDENPP